jgi:hypothetical protein
LSNAVDILQKENGKKVSALGEGFCVKLCGLSCDIIAIIEYFPLLHMPDL